MRKKVLEQEFIRLNADYKALLDETIQLREKVATADEALEKMRATEENVRSIHENTRRLKHDMRNHLMVIAMSLGNEKYDEARTYTAQILDKLNLEYSYIDSGNALLNYILNLKLQQAQQMQVHMQLQIENLKFQKIDSVDFSSLLTNLLDNAIHAAANSDKRQISVSISKKRGYEAISVRNSINSSVLAVNPDLHSTHAEPEKHGMGIKQIRAIIEKYNGLLDIYEEDIVFCVNVMLPAG